MFDLKGLFHPEWLRIGNDTQHDHIMPVGYKLRFFEKWKDASQLTYINTSGVMQFRLCFAKDDNNDKGADYLKIFSGNAGAANRPQLIIEYHVP
jgi:hypothetical protein